MKYLISMMVCLLMSTQAIAVDQQELAFMKDFFKNVQQKSFETKNEYCGFVALGENDQLITTEPTKGDAYSCYAEDAPLDFDYFASYHTYGAYTPEKYSELPSPDDLITSISEQIDGYIATPGGRIWFNDAKNKTATLACEHCVPQDPNFVEDSSNPTKKLYTVKTLEQRWEEHETVEELAEQQEPDFAAEDLIFVKKLFNDIQQKSFTNNREYCGYIGFDKNDQLIATKATKGEIDGCLADEPPEDMALYASYHTHGAFSTTDDTEVPSFDDIAADMQEQVDGFVATPGGRVWRIDGKKGIATLQCGRNCILSDPKFDDEIMDPFEKSYTLEELKIRQLD